MRARERLRRLDRIERAVEPQLVTREIVLDAFERFRATGELPEHQRLAAHVAHYAQRGWLTGGLATDLERAIRVEELMDTAARRKRGEPVDPPNVVRDQLFAEAVHGDDLMQQVARLAFVRLVERGADLADKLLLADRTRPAFGSVGMMLLGWPDLLATPPYEAQARRLFERHAALAQRARADDEHWAAAVAGAMVAFYECGDLPDDELRRDGVLAFAEFRALADHRSGHEVAELLAALDAAATTAGQEREDAIARVQKLAVRDPA